MSKKISVVNRSRGAVGIDLSGGKTKYWKKTGDVVYFTMDELLEMTTISGGRKLLEKYLFVEDEEAQLAVYSQEMPPEYSYNERHIDLLLYELSEDYLADAIKFAPAGVLDLLKDHGMRKLPNTMAKIEMINNALGVNLQNMHNLYLDVENTVEEDTSNNGRKTSGITLESKKVEVAAEVAEDKPEEQVSQENKYKVIKMTK